MPTYMSAVITVGLGHPFGSQLRVNRVLNLLSDDGVRLLGVIDGDPFVGVIFRKVGTRHVVCLDVLGGCNSSCQQEEPYCASNSNNDVLQSANHYDPPSNANLGNHWVRPSKTGRRSCDELKRTRTSVAVLGGTLNCDFYQSLREQLCSGRASVSHDSFLLFVSLASRLEYAAGR